MYILDISQDLEIYNAQQYKTNLFNNKDVKRYLEDKELENKFKKFATIFWENPSVNLYEIK